MLSNHHLPHSGRFAVEEHSALIKCLEKGDMAAAVRQMEHHLNAVANRALQPLAPRRAFTDFLAKPTVTELEAFASPLVKTLQE
jgi:DNA-binding GntR family transcriptional regulator